MKILTSVFLLAALTSSATAWATDPPPRYGATKPYKPPTEADQAKVDAPKEGEKAIPVAAGKKPKRRAVYQHFDEIPMRTPPTAGYGPTLTPPLYGPALTPRVDPTPVPPATTVNCVGNSCIDPAGGSYKGGVGTTLIGPQGRVCSNNGITVQCF